MVAAACALLGACAEPGLAETDGGRNDARVVDDASASSCDEENPCEMIDPPWEPEADGGLDASPDEGTDASDPFDAPAAMDGSRPADAARDSASDVRVDALRDTGVRVALPPPTCANIDQRLRADFGIVIRPGTLAFEGLASEDIGCADRIKVYQMFELPFAYERYPRRLDPSDAFTMHLYRGRSPTLGSCSAYVPSSQAMQIRDLSQCLRSVSGRTDSDFMRIAMFLIHESGHIITARTPSLRTAFSTANLPSRDASCYDRGFLKSYSLRSTNPVSESFAESVALFIGRRKVGSLGTINDFRRDCPNTFAWVRDNVFGDPL